MNKESLLSIGDVTKLSKVSHKTLRYYDQMGLLEPAWIDSNNRYRFYRKDQVTQLATIKQLQEFGISLEMIRNFFNENTPSGILNNLKNLFEIQETRINEEIALLTDKLKKIKIMKSCYNDYSKNLLNHELERAYVKKFPQRTIIFQEYTGSNDTSVFRKSYQTILDRIESQGLDFNNICSPPLVVKSDYANGQETNLKIGYEIKSEVGFEEFNTIKLQEGNYHCLLYHGNYHDLQSFALKEIEIGRLDHEAISRSTRLEIFLINEATANMSNKFLTEIQFIANNI